MASFPREGRPVGQSVPPQEASYPQRREFRGQHVHVEPLAAAHADTLFQLINGDENAHLWDYLAGGPFSPDDHSAFRDFVAQQSFSKDPFFFAIVDPNTRTALGWASLMRIDLPNRVVEIGNILFSQPLQRTPAATEAIYLLAAYAFDDLNYRRLEWKCNDLNAPSKRAAERLGFRFEGLFRQHMIVKGRNRDTAWYSIIDTEWPEVKHALRDWLSPENFDEHKKQRRRLEQCRSGTGLNALASTPS